MPTFTRQAGSVSVPSAPQLQTNTGSTVGDLATAAQFGVNLFDRSQAIKESAAQQASVEAGVLAKEAAVANLDQGSEAVLAFRNSQNLTGVALENAVNNFTIGEASRRGLLTGSLRTQVAKFSGGSVIERRDRAQSAEDAVATAEANEMIQREEDSQSLNDEGSLLQGWSKDNFELGMSDSEKRAWIFKAKTNKSIHDVESDKLTLQRGKTEDVEKERILRVKQFSSTTAQLGTNSVVIQIKDLMRGMNRLDVAQNTEMRGVLDASVAEYSAKIGGIATESGITLSQGDVKELTTAFAARLQPMYNRLDTEQDVKQLTAALDMLSLSIFNIPNPTPEEMKAQNALSSSKITGLDLGREFAGDVLAANAGRAMSSISPSAVAQSVWDKAKDAQLSDEQANVVRELALERHFDTFFPVTKETIPEAKEINFEKLMTTVTGTQKSINEDVAGSWNILLEAFSGDKASTLISDENKNEALHAIAVPAQQVVLGSLQTIMQTPQSAPLARPTGPFVAGAELMLLTGEAQDTEFTYAFDKETLEFYPLTSKGSRAAPTQDIRDFNQIIKRTLNMYEALGATPDVQMLNLRNDLWNGIVGFDRSRIKEVNAEETKEKKKDN